MSSTLISGKRDAATTSSAQVQFLERFPRARFIATPDVVKIMAQQASPQFLASFWNARFPGQISDHLVIA
jgi:hypothetical protein